MLVRYILPAMVLLAVSAPVLEAQTAPPAPKDSVARVIDRLPLSASSFAITNRDEGAALLLLDSTIVLQLTDRGLQKLGRDMGRETAEKPNFLKAVLGAVVAGTVFTMLDHGIEYSLRDLKEARVEGGVLVLENRAGEHVFEDVTINDSKVLATFTESSARRFAKRVNEAARKLR